MTPPINVSVLPVLDDHGLLAAVSRPKGFSSPIETQMITAKTAAHSRRSARLPTR
jgi:hypothetical protein